jgi:DNA repair protein RadC
MNNPHAGHRKRLRGRFLSEGLDGFDEHNVLELLLFYAVPQGDVNPLAHRLIDTFGSLAGVLDAPAEALCRVDGVGACTAALLSMMPALFRRYQMSGQLNSLCLDTAEKAGAYLLPRFIGCRNECVYLLCLDAKSKPVCCRRLFEGSVNAAQVGARRVVETALSVNAAGVILAHNHLSGIALPSPEDEETTRRLQGALEAVGIPLIDHIIVADGDCVSLAQSGLLAARP